MPDIVNVNYHNTGNSTKINTMGMREMQTRAFESRDAQYLLLKAPPASGKSRALMFLALDKLVNQGTSALGNLIGGTKPNTATDSTKTTTTPKEDIKTKTTDAIKGLLGGKKKKE